MPKHQECFKNNFFPEMPILRNVHAYIFLNGIWSFHYTVQLFHSSKMHLGFPERNANILSKNTRTAEFYRNKKFRPNPGEKACLGTYNKVVSETFFMHAYVDVKL